MPGRWRCKTPAGGDDTRSVHGDRGRMARSDNTMVAAQMHAAVLHGIEQTPRYEQFPAPVAGDSEVVVTVAAAALKPSDRLMAKGVHYAPRTFPKIVGLDGVGRLPDGTPGGVPASVAPLRRDG